MGTTTTMNPIVKFHCFIPEAAEKWPIVRSHQIDFNWVAKAKEYYTTNELDSDKKTTRCPGIFSVMGTGWIQRSYQDIYIETNGDGETFFGMTKEDQVEMANGTYLGQYVAWHGSNQLYMFKKFQPNTLEAVIKINSPWFVEIPDGYSLLVLPIPYSDEVRFTSAIGILRGNQYLNPQLYWHCLHSEEVIPAGTPLNQMILVKDEKVDYTVSVVEDAKSFLDQKFYRENWTANFKFF